jgi:hypothetical protein
VLAVGARPQINRVVLEAGGEPRYEAGCRVTDAAALQAAIRAAGQARMEVESRLSKVRRGRVRGVVAVSVGARAVLPWRGRASMAAVHGCRRKQRAQGSCARKDAGMAAACRDATTASLLGRRACQPAWAAVLETPPSPPPRLHRAPR